MAPKLHLNYIGSKKTLLPTLLPFFAEHVNAETTFIDLFAGTGSVGRGVQEAFQCRVVANDLQYYAFAINSAILTDYTPEERASIGETIRAYNAYVAHPDADAPGGFIARHYAPPARSYFTRENAVRMDILRARLERDLYEGTLSPRVYTYVLAALLIAADRVANTSSVYASYLKKFKASALRPLVLPEDAEAPAAAPAAAASEVFHGDAVTLLDTLPENPNAVVYLDPPYNGRQYSVYYHILETLALADDPALHGVTGMRDQNNLSDFSSKIRAAVAFRDLFTRLRKFPTIMLSYNDEGIVPIADLVQMMETAYGGVVTVHAMPYRKFKAQKSVKRKMVTEHLIVATR